MEQPSLTVMGRCVKQIIVYNLIREKENRKNLGENTTVV